MKVHSLRKGSQNANRAKHYPLICYAKKWHFSDIDASASNYESFADGV